MKKLIALYGITNVGKSTQIELLKTRGHKEGISIYTQKYPVYDLEPTGSLIHGAIKGGNPRQLSAGEIQALMAKNRFDFQPKLETLMDAYDLVFSEMYTGTGIAYGIGDGVNTDVLFAINEGLFIPSVSILLDGNRFVESIERGHRFEEDFQKTDHIRRIHLELAKKYQWHIVDANQHKEAVHRQIWDIVTDSFSF